MTFFSYLRDHAFDIMLVVSISIILFLYIINYGNRGKGTWTKSIDELRTLIKKDNYINPLSTEQHRPKESILEAATRDALLRIFKKPFIKCRPNFLRNPVTSDYNLEIDCFNEELKLCVEVHGRQHYEHVPFFHKSRSDFLNQKYRDELKRRLIRENGYIYVEVPYTVNPRDVEQYIISKTTNIPL